MDRNEIIKQDMELLKVMASEVDGGNPNPGLTDKITNAIVINDEWFFMQQRRRPNRPVRWLCNCGAPLNGNHDHYSCGPPIPEIEATGEGYDLGGEGGGA